MTDSLRIRWGMWNASAVALAAAVCVLAALVAATGLATMGLGAQAPTGDASAVSPALAKVAADHPAKQVQAIVQLNRGTSPQTGRKLVSELSGRTTGELPIINGLV